MFKQLILAGAGMSLLVGACPKPHFKGSSLSISLDAPVPYEKLSSGQLERALALTMFGEARNGGWEAMRGVGFVIVNRAAKRHVTLDKIVWKRKWFSCWNAGDPNREILRHIGRLENARDKIMWTQAKGLAHMFIVGRAGPDVTHGADHYAVEKLHPWWSHGMRVTALIGGHKFYKSR